MKSIVLLLSAVAVAYASPAVYTYAPYTGPSVPIGDWVDPTLNGNGKGYTRLVEAPAVTPNSSKPTNNINVISMSYLPTGMNIHFQTPFGIGSAPKVVYGTSSSSLSQSATGSTKTYDRTPSCGQTGAVTQCSQFFHDVPLSDLQSDTTYYYKIPGGNGTTSSNVLSFKTGKAAGASGSFSGELSNGNCSEWLLKEALLFISVAVLNDMGYTNAEGTHANLQALTSGDSPVAFAWHGGDISGLKTLFYLHLY